MIARWAALLFTLAGCTNTQTVPLAPDFRPAPLDSTLTRHLNDELGPVWSPDGEYIAYVAHHDGNPELYLMNARTGDTRNLSQSPADDFDPVWSPDGQQITFKRGRYTGFGQLHIVDLETGNITALPEPVTKSSPVWTPDSRALLFEHGSSLARYHIPTRTYEVIFSAEIYMRMQVYLSPNRSQAITVSRTPWYGDLPQVISQHIDLETGIVTTIAEGYLLNVAWKPDSTEAAVVLSREGDIPDELYRYTPATHTLHPVADGDNLLYLQWLHDGETLLWCDCPLRYVTMPFSTFFTQTTHTGTLTNVYTIQHPVLGTALSPNEDWLAFETASGVYVLNVQAGIAHNFFAGQGMIHNLAWSADGRYLSAALGGSRRHGWYNTLNAIAFINVGTGTLYRYDHRRPASMPQWAPSGASVVLSTQIQRGNTNLIHINMP